MASSTVKFHPFDNNAYNLKAINMGNSKYLYITPNVSDTFFTIFAMNRRANAKPFGAMVQLYGGVVNTDILTNLGDSTFTAELVDGRIKVTLPDTYYMLWAVGYDRFTLENA